MRPGGRGLVFAWDEPAADERQLAVTGQGEVVPL